MNISLQRAFRSFHSARHLRLPQVVSLVRHGLSAPPHPAFPEDWSPADTLDPRVVAALGALGPVDSPCSVAARVRAFGEGRVEMLGLIIAWNDAWIDDPGAPPLWRYHLQYHDLLAEAAWTLREDGDLVLASQMVRALDRWVENRGRGGSPAWDAYPVSVRLVNWLRIFAWAGTHLPRDVQGRLRSLHAAHVNLLSRRLERHLRGNHLLRNACALVVGSHAWTGAWSHSLQRESRELFAAEVLAQVGNGGIHEERSPMYQVRALRDALEVVAVLDAVGVTVPPAIRERIRAMAEVVPWLRRSDGSLFLLNDTANDHGVDLDRLLTLAVQLVGAAATPAHGVRLWRDAGLLIAVDPAGRLLMDLGAPAPAHQPGHAHAGALGVDLDLAGVPLLVDPGVSGYDSDPLRAYFRGTAAHNTVMIDAKDQSEMWGTFRVARRAIVDVGEVRGNADAILVSGVCRAYHDRAAQHYRRVQRRGNTLFVDDRVAGAFGKCVDVHWHLHPSWTASREGRSVALRHQSGARAVVKMEAPDAVTLHRGEQRPALGWYAEGFGQVVPTWTIRGTVNANDGRTVRTVIELAS